MMIDWLSATITAPSGLSVGYDSGRNLKLNPHGEIIRETRSPLAVKDDADPSSSRNFLVFTPDQRTLYLSGNPVKLIQGHNLFGSDDLNGLYLEAGVFIRRNAGLFPSPESYDSCEFTKPKYSRIDITRSYRFNTQTEVSEFIRYTAGTARSRHGAAVLHGSETAYFGKNSRRWSMKVYDKHSEFLKNSSALCRNKFTRGILRPLMQEENDLIDWSKGIVRFELCLRGQELTVINKQILHNALPDWLSVWTSYYEKIQFNDNAAMTTDHTLLEATLKPSQKAVFELWRSGKDLRSIYPKPTFYRHRSAILAVLGVDIASPPSTDSDSARSTTGLDPARFDPEPLESRLVEPRKELKEAYKLI